MPAKGAQYTALKGDARARYTQAHWGHAPRHAASVDLPGLQVAQHVWEMGKLRRLDLYTAQGRQVFRVPRPYPSLLIGTRDARIYLHGGSIPRWRFPVGFAAQVRRIDYDATKGAEDAYWFHKHDEEYPALYFDPRYGGYPRYLGGDYEVAEEGIVG